MILTCPACDTKYVVKEGAIPPAGRQVRCASCKHSWHQNPEPLDLADMPTVEEEIGGPPQPDPDEPGEEHFGEVPPSAEREAMIADAPEPAIEPGFGDIGHANPLPDRTNWGLETPVVPTMPDAGEPAMEQSAFVSPNGEPAINPEPEADAEATSYQPEEEFVGYVERYDDERRPRRVWPLLLGLVLLIIAAAAAFWYLAPAEWKARAGIAEAGATPLQLMITTSDRQPLESGNELVAISGRVINPTDQEQNVPPIHAELRNKQTRAVVHQWIIAPPARVLAARSSASFNSAEVDVPKGGDELTVTLGGAI